MSSSHIAIPTEDGRVYAAGSNTSGCSGLGSAYSTYPTVTEFLRLPVSDISSVSYGTSTSFLLTNDSEVMSVGSNTNGQLGLGNTTNQTDLAFVKVDASTRLSNVADVAAGDSHAVFVLTDGSALACGLNTEGQLGDISSNAQKTYPSRVLSAAATPLPKAISSVGAGAAHTVLGATDGTAWACGSNNKGQIGAGPIYSSSGSSGNISIQNAGLINSVTKALWLSNDTNYMTMDGQNRISQWSDRSGNGRHATQSSDGAKPTYSASTKSVDFNGSSQGFIIDLDFLSGTSHMAFILTKPTTNFRPIYGAATAPSNSGEYPNSLHVGFSSSSAYMMNIWYNDFMPNTTSNFISADFNLVAYKWIPGTSKTIFANALEEGTNNTAGTLGTMKGGGRLGLNVVGSGYYGGSITEIIFLTGANITEQNINIVNSYMMKIINDNYRAISAFPTAQLYTNYTLQVKTDATTGISSVSRVVAGGNHSLALTSGGNVYSWGSNTAGQLGINTNVDSEYATLVLTSGGATLANIAQVAAGANHSLFLTTSGAVFACGLNTSGQLGNNTTTSSNQLVSVLNPAGTAALSGITKITAIANTSFFLASDGTLYACGSNAQNQMGFANSGATTYYALPVQLSLVDFTKAKAAGYSSRDNRLLGYEPWQQQYYGESIFNITSAGYSTTDLLNSGLSIGALKSAGVTSSQVSYMGFSDEQAYPPSYITSTASLAASASLFTRRANGNFAQAVTSAIHGTKIYDMSASSHFLSGDSVDLPPSAFSSTQVWRSEELWNTSTGAYTGSATTTMSGTSYSGEWIQIQLPVGIRLSSYSFVPSSSRTPLVFYLGGSVDGSTWTLLDSRNISTTGGMTSKFTPTVGGMFNYYRLVVNAVQTSNDGFLALSRFQLNTTSVVSNAVMSATDLSLAGYNAVEIISAGKSITGLGITLPANSGYAIKQLRDTGYTYGDIVRNTDLKVVKVGQPSLTASNIGSLMSGALLDAPSSFSATGRDASSISVAISAPGFSTGLTGYSVQAVPITGGSTVTKSLGPAGTLVDGLDAGKIYDLRVRSVNANGSSPARVLRNSTQLSALPALNEGTITASSIVVNFAALPTTQDCSYVLRTTPASNQYVLANGATTQTLSGLTQTTTYSIILEASNAFVSAVPVSRSSTTSDPPPPLATNTNVLYAANLFGSSTINITGQTPSYRNGTYTVTESSYFNNDPTYRGHKAFNLSTGTLYHSAAIYSSGAYIGTVKTTNITGSTDISGEWVQIQLPYYIILRSVGFVERGGGGYPDGLPKNIFILGSNDGTSWEIVNQQTVTSYPVTTLKTLNIVNPPNTPYRYIRLIANRVMGGGIFQLSQINYNGDIYS